MYALLRMIHVLAGIFIGGTYLFLVPILEPRLRRLGPGIQAPVIRSLMPVMAPAMGISSVVPFGTGVALTLMRNQGSLLSLLTTAWGLAILVGAVATVAYLVIGFGIITPTGIRMDRMGKSIGQRAPTPDERQQLQQLSAKVDRLSRINFGNVLIALATMLVSGFL